tara:strand:+ start:779 stop:904 length:126 start_codon:yes stop_codon:yes gene_type:complete
MLLEVENENKPLLQKSCIKPKLMNELRITIKLLGKYGKVQF